ncbi:hypothetical protein BHM03_00033372 [Ensete ventricosum]|nr:hypothetical protein BHM03_00033372 [Ensete ventricosum]
MGNLPICPRRFSRRQSPENLGGGDTPVANQWFNRWESRKSDSLYFFNPDLNHMLSNSLRTPGELPPYCPNLGPMPKLDPGSMYEELVYYEWREESITRGSRVLEDTGDHGIVAMIATSDGRGEGGGRWQPKIATSSVAQATMLMAKREEGDCSVRKER